MTDIEKIDTPMASIDTSKPVVPGGRDETINIMSLLKGEDDVTKTADKPKKKSALEMAKEQREQQQKGLIVDTNELEEKSTPKSVGNKTEVDAVSEIDAYTAEQDALIAAAKKVVIENPPKTQLEMAALMNNLENVARTGDVKSDPNRDANPEMFSDTPDEGNIIRLKTDEEMEAAPDKAITEGVPIDSATDTVEKSEEDKEKERIATVLIDKTGFGGDFAFTDEEREKLFMSTEIHLKEIEDVNLSTLVVKKPDKSFVEAAQEYQFSSSQTVMTFPASRFKAEMGGLTYGEMGDISVNNENVTFEQIRKKLTVIYNKMKNPSCGKFESFDDFLKKFAYVDLDLAVYGLVISTFPEIDDIPLNCQNPKCKKSFNHRFSPRTLLQMNKCSKKFLDDMHMVIHATQDELATLPETSPAQNYKVIRLPMSGFVIKIGIASAYDYLYTIVDNVLGSKFADEHPDDVNGILQLNSMLLSLIRGVLIPNPDGSYTEYESFEDMIHALYDIKPEEIKILTAILQKYNNVYNVPFELVNIRCPHCGTITKTLAVDINYLVFMKYQRLMSEELDVDNIILL